MPAVSGRQYRLMQAIAHSDKKLDSIGPSKEVARKFIKETSPEKRRLFSKSKKK